MKNKNNRFKNGCWLFVYAILLTGCSKEHMAEEIIVGQEIKEETEREETEQQEMEAGNVLSAENRKDMEDESEDMAADSEIVHAD